MKYVHACLVIGSVLGLVACSGNDETEVGPTEVLPVEPDDSAPPATRGPLRIELDADPNGLWWDAPSETLYIADDDGNRILTWTEAEGVSRLVDLPSSGDESPGLGQLVLTADGTLVVTRFGYGTAGDVVFVPPGGEPQLVPGLDPARRRVGLTVTDDGRLFDAWFVRLDSGERAGAVGELTLDGSELEVITGLQKPVGVFAQGSDLYVSEQDRGEILKAPIDDPASYDVLATLESPDLITLWGEGNLLTGSIDGNLYLIDAAGEASVLETGFQQVRGVAYDSANRRAFVADHDGDDSDGLSHTLHIIPAE